MFSSLTELSAYFAAFVCVLLFVCSLLCPTFFPQNCYIQVLNSTACLKMCGTQRMLFTTSTANGFAGVRSRSSLPRVTERVWTLSFPTWSTYSKNCRKLLYNYLACLCPSSPQPDEVQGASLLPQLLPLRRRSGRPEKTFPEPQLRAAQVSKPFPWTASSQIWEPQKVSYRQIYFTAPQTPE